MAKFKVLKSFRDIHTKEDYVQGLTVDMMVKRSVEVANNLDDTYLERVDKVVK